MAHLYSNGIVYNSLQVVELSGHSDLQIVVNKSLQTVSSMVYRIRVSLQRLSWLITHQSRMTLGLLAIMATHHLRRCTPEPWPYYKVSMSGVCWKCHRYCGELFMQQQQQLGMQLLQFPTHSTETTTNINSNTSCQWEFIHHYAIQSK